VKYAKSGTALTTITIAINSSWFDKATNSKKEETTYVDVTLFGKLCELAGEHLRKGSGCLISGRLKTESWDDKATGQKRSKLVVIGEEMQFIGGRDAGGRDSNSSNRETESRPRTETVSAPVGEDFSPNDDVPF
jgi:single-strand DNA-binding protein